MTSTGGDDPGEAGSGRPANRRSRGTNAVVRSDAPLPRRSARFFDFFARYLRRYLKRSFHRVLLAADPVPSAPPERPTIVVLNHPSWHDPLLCVLLARALFPGRPHFAPIDAEALRRYAFLARLGLFPVEPDSHAGRRAFLRAGVSVLAEPGAMLWITAQGQFADPRQRPLELMPGIAHLAARTPQVRVIPLAIELAFWHERLPEALAAFGPPLDHAGCPAGGITEGRKPLRQSIGSWNESVTRALEATQNRLAELSIGRREDAFRVLLQGSRRTDPFFDALRRIRARITGRPYTEGHGDLVRRS